MCVCPRLHAWAQRVTCGGKHLCEHTCGGHIRIYTHISSNLALGLVAQSCLTLCDLMDCSPPGSNLDSILKIRGITLSTKVHMVKAMVFPVAMYGCGSWIVKKSECQRIDAFELWCWRRLSRVLCTTRRSNQSILMEINLGYSF